MIYYTNSFHPIDGEIFYRSFDELNENEQKEVIVKYQKWTGAIDKGLFRYSIARKTWIIGGSKSK